MIGVELFSGPGGMGLGAKMAGIDVRLAVEKDPYAAQTYLANHKTTTVVVDHIENILSFNFERRNDPVVLFGGPPCQGYSNSNRKTRSSENPKNWLFKQFIRAANIVQPDWIVIENVPGLKTMEKGLFIERICDDLHQLGFTPNVGVLNAADFGVPQIRDRVFIVGTRGGVAFEFPKGSFSDNHVTVEDAISDLPSLSVGDMERSLPYKTQPRSEYAKLMRGNLRKATQNYVSRNSEVVLARYPHVRQGGNWRDIPDGLMNNYTDHSRCHAGIYRRLASDSPSVVIANYRKSMLIHPTENRGLSLREAARLQSFPDNYEFHGSLIYQQQQVGDAVPPLLAKAVFAKLIQLN